MLKQIIPLIALGTILLGYAVYHNQKSISMHTETGVSKFEEMAYRINSQSENTWTAQVYPKMTYNQEKLSRMFNLIIEDKIPENFDEMPLHSIGDESLPESFDPKTKWPKCMSLKDVRDQSSCGSCWAFGATEAMSDRVCIHSGQKDQTRISPEDLMECCHSCGFGCNGGFLYASWSYWKSTGIVTGYLYNDKKFCKPYKFPECNHHSHNPSRKDCSEYHFSTPSCSKKCSNGKNYNDSKVFGKKVYSVTGENNMMRELVENGPFEVAISVYEDFLLYKSGVYQHKTGGFLGGHAIKLLGYGVENGVKYWYLANSWNSDWGDKGYFKIIRGKDECGIEYSGVAGLP